MINFWFPTLRSVLSSTIRPCIEAQTLCWKDLEEEDLSEAGGADRAGTIQESPPACPRGCPGVKGEG